MPETLNPILSADRWNKIIRMGARRFERSLLVGMMNLFQDQGRMAGQEPYNNKMQELIDLLAMHDDLLEMSLNDPVPGRRLQAQNELLRMERLRREVLEDAESAA